MSYLEQHRDEIFKKYSTEELLKDVNNYKYGKGRLNKVLNHFFEECIFNCKSNKYSNTPIEVLQDDEKNELYIKLYKVKTKFLYIK